MKLSRNDSRVLAMAILYQVDLFEKKDIDYELITNYVENLSENQRTFLFYKNNLLIIEKD